MVAGIEVFEATWDAIPQHKAVYRLAYTPFDNFAIWVMVGYRSAAVWADYLGIEGQSCATDPRIITTYSARVSDAAVVDLQLQKWFWQRKLVGSLLFRNLLNRNYHYHPIGASFDLSLYIKLELILGS